MHRGGKPYIEWKVGRKDIEVPTVNKRKMTKFMGTSLGRHIDKEQHDIINSGPFSSGSLEDFFSYISKNIWIPCLYHSDSQEVCVCMMSTYTRI